VQNFRAPSRERERDSGYSVIAIWDIKDPWLNSTKSASCSKYWRKAENSGKFGGERQDVEA